MRSSSSLSQFRLRIGGGITCVRFVVVLFMCLLCSTCCGRSTAHPAPHSKATHFLVQGVVAFGLSLVNQVRCQFSPNPYSLDNVSADLLDGSEDGSELGVRVVGIGDVNADTFDDLLVGAWKEGRGVAYVLFGSVDVPQPLLTADLNDTLGARFVGAVPDIQIGWDLAGVGDVNGDGIPDFMIGSYQGDSAYLIFGSSGGWTGSVNLNENDLGGGLGVVFSRQVGDGTGRSVAGLGDVNGDGVHDFAIGAPSDSTRGAAYGRVDVLYGRNDTMQTWPTVVDLAAYVNASTGFTVFGTTAQERCGFAVAGAGDVNMDGLADVVFGCPSPLSSEAESGQGDGRVAVVFGSSNASFPANVDSLNGTNGFTVVTGVFGDELGTELAGVGDVNNDQVDDFVMGAWKSNSTGRKFSGAMFCAFGRQEWPARVNATLLASDGQGFIITGSHDNARLGARLSSGADVNGDNINDVLVGVFRANTAHLLYGRQNWPTVAQAMEDLTDTVAFTNSVGGNCGSAVAHAGNMDGDGHNDVAIGCFGADMGALVNSGQVAIVRGVAPTSAPTTATPTSPPTTTPPTTASPTVPSVTPSCDSPGAFIPPGATCVNGVLVTSSNVTTPVDDEPTTVGSSITVTGGASFTQPAGSTLVFVANGDSVTNVVVEDGGCALISGDAVVTFETDPGASSSGSTGALTLITSQCVTGSFGAVSGNVAFTSDDCITLGTGDQVATTSSISVTFPLQRGCDNGGKQLSTGALVGIIVGVSVVTIVVVIVLVQLAKKARYRRAVADTKHG